MNHLQPGGSVFTRIRQWQRRHSSLVTGLMMAFLWTCLGIASASVLVKVGLFPVAAWKLFDTLNVHFTKLEQAREASKEEKTPHIGGGLTSSAAAPHPSPGADKELAHVG